MRRIRRLCFFYNDAEAEVVNPKSDAIYAMVRDFRQRGVPIDGVGLQMHIAHIHADVASISDNIKRLTALGVQVHITEMDVALPVDSLGNARPEDLRQQADIYREIVSACLDAGPSRPGDSLTNIRGLDRTRSIPRERRCSLTADTGRSLRMKLCGVC